MKPATDAAPAQPRRRRRAWRVGMTLIAGVLLVVAVDEVRHTLDRAEEKRTLDGVGNFGQLSPYLYRGAQPSSAGFAALKRLGIDTVVRVSTEKGLEAEQAEVERLGMHFVGLPWSSLHTPTEDQVTTFLALTEASPRRTIFIHCKAGADRTGVMVALYRIAVDRWSADDAVSEMKAFHYRYYLLPHLENYVDAFPAVLATDPRLRALSTGAD